MCSRFELLLMPCRFRSLSHRCFSGSGWVFKIQIFLLHHGIYHLTWCNLRSIYILCPFGWFQDLLHKIPGKKFSTQKLKPLRYLKYLILLVFVILLPMLVTNSIGMGDPFFCKYICPQGVLEGAIPLSLGNAAIRSALGKLFTFKSIILITVVVLSILFYRPFCKWICPLGAIYSLFNKISFLGIKIENDKCIGCQQCTKACKMDVNVLKTPNHPECIRCGACMKVCPKDAIHYQFMGKDMCIHKHKGTK